MFKEKEIYKESAEIICNDVINLMVGSVTLLGSQILNMFYYIMIKPEIAVKIKKEISTVLKIDKVDASTNWHDKLKYDLFGDLEYIWNCC